MTNLGKQPLQLVEMDIDFCQEEYGVAPCTASGSAGEECYQTFKTCQDQENFNKGTLTLTFSKNQATGIKNQIVFPALQSVSTNPTKITLGQADDKLGSLGKRARVTLRFKDFRWSDQKVDPYVSTRSYDPMTQGTFFGKLRARYPYYYGRSIRIKEGYVGDTIASMPTRHYIITEFNGPDIDGNVTITAQDPLKLADEEFSQAPEPSNGKLSDNISAVATTLTLTPETVGDEYDSSGRAIIGDEIVSFTRSGDVITLTARGLDGTEASSHDEDDTFQQCLRFENQTIDSVAETLLVDYAGIDPSFITSADWASEINRWMTIVSLTRTIPKPTPVKRLLSQLADFGVVFWWDEQNQKIRLKANRPPDFDETFITLDEDVNSIEKTTKNEYLDDQRLTQVWVYHGLISEASQSDDPENYKKVTVATDLQAESDNEYGQRRILEIFAPWLGLNGSDVISRIAARRLLNRYRDTPQRLTQQYDIKDKASVNVADLVKIVSSTTQDETGASLPVEMQVISSEEVRPSERLEIIVQSYQFIGRFGFFTENARGDYAAASEAEKTKGTYFSDGDNNFADGTPPYKFF